MNELHLTELQRLPNFSMRVVKAERDLSVSCQERCLDQGIGSDCCKSVPVGYQELGGFFFFTSTHTYLLLLRFVSGLLYKLNQQDKKWRELQVTFTQVIVCRIPKQTEKAVGQKHVNNVYFRQRPKRECFPLRCEEVSSYQKSKHTSLFV